MKKILIVGPLFYGYSKSVAEAFEHHGFTVDLFDEWTEGAVDNFREKIVYNASRDKKKFFDNKKQEFLLKIY